MTLPAQSLVIRIAERLEEVEIIDHQLAPSPGQTEGGEEEDKQEKVWLRRPE
jgi:hypothetical protein